MAHMTSSQSDHHEKLRKDDMEAVLQIKRTVEEKMQNPFHPSLATDKLMNISTGQILAATTLVDAKRLDLKAMDAATTTNADKIAEVANSWEPLKELPPSAADAVYVVDAKAFIQRLNALGSSAFGQLQERYREKLLNMKPRHCTGVHFVDDQ
ncbi:hypothetical protein GQR58_012279 [Nymphon striatum]|nr:hypothetical protein GQR58_012279 [Nymphon striatum]